ncbi:2-isopropylmalate synthase [Thermoflavimicrobium daqui]|jgi:2-isopropylmalate synthase|uniref:2-isopropylmalate synthase n=1 Tax=Thermoflavimicrobium daqui TaxID=2137476 RepID=A0A364K950_9BACL|nr:2-isopropylmalate synthase [Thermoflavimicrobium daqui]RAL26808.1 2-isopropylmalate synthase [Thermoflavimicrobium daqui]
MDQIQIFDTTLRDGEQSPGVNLSTEEKIEIALQLERLGIDIIEAGFAAASPGDLYSIQQIANRLKEVSVCSLSRCVKSDIDKAWEALREAAYPRLHIFISTSPIHREYKLRMSKEQILESVDEMVRYGKSRFPIVQFSAEDAGRTEIDYLCAVVDQAIRAGADVINIPDTVGYLYPDEYAEIFIQLQKRVPNIDRVILSAHCHDDLGMAVVNSLAAVRTGVRQIEGTINGIGERAGNAALEEVIMAIKTREDFFQKKTSIRHSEIARTSRLVSKFTGMFVQKNKAIVGDNAFAHESGIHQDGMLKNKETYEIMTPETVGMDESLLVLGKHSGRHAFKKRLEELGYPQSDEQINVLFTRFKELADRKKEITEEDIIALVEEKIGEGKEFYTLESVQISYGSHSVPTASLRVRDHSSDQLLEEAACGNGSVDAIFKTVDRMIDEKVELIDFKIHSVTHGKDALGEVSVQLEQEEIQVRGRGVSTDILEACARAYLDAINRLLRRKERKTVGCAN